jgi:DNA polymerase-3 subunit delta
MAACDTAPFLGDKRLVVVEGLLGEAGRPKRGRKKAAAEIEDEDDGSAKWRPLVEYIDRMPPTTTLVLIDDAVPATGLLKEIGPKGKVQSFSPPDEKQLPRWVMDRSKEIGLRIDSPAARTLAELVGVDEEGKSRGSRTSHMGMLATEMEKLAAYANGEVVRESDVRELVGRAREQKAWELTDAITGGQAATAARLLQEQIEDGRAMQVILSTVAGKYRRIAVAKDMHERGESGTAIASRLGIKPGFGVEKLIDQAERLSWEALRAAYARIVGAR